jgi:hypothetical protein
VWCRIADRWPTQLAFPAQAREAGALFPIGNPQLSSAQVAIQVTDALRSIADESQSYARTALLASWKVSSQVRFP